MKPKKDNVAQLIDEFSEWGFIAVEIFGISYSPANTRINMNSIPEPSEVLCRYLMNHGYCLMSARNGCVSSSARA